MLTLNVSGFSYAIYDSSNDHVIKIKHKIIEDHAHYFFAAAIPLGYATKSIMIPMSLINVGLFSLWYQYSIHKDCYFCSNESELRQIRQRAVNREVVMRALWQQYGAINSLEKLNEILDKEV